MFQEGSALNSDYSDVVTTNSAYTVIVWIYVYTLSQIACLFGKVDVLNQLSTLCFGIQSGKLTLMTYDTSNTINFNETSNSNHFGQGWNMVSYVDNGAQLIFKSAKNFASIQSEPLVLNINPQSMDHAIIGGYINGTIMNSFEGVIHSLWIVDSFLSDAAMESYIAPTTD